MLAGVMEAISFVPSALRIVFTAKPVFSASSATDMFRRPRAARICDPVIKESSACETCKLTPMLQYNTNDSNGGVAMKQSTFLPPECPIHGKPTKREACKLCNAAYMREYMRQRRFRAPGRALWERARRRAGLRSVCFSLPRDSIVIPPTCPVFGTPIRLGERRSESSPSLDRIIPARGYVAGNVRVISDKANRLKGDRSRAQLEDFARRGPQHRRADYDMVVTYLDRENLLAEIRQKAAQGGRAGEEWTKVADFLDRIFSRSIIKSRPIGSCGGETDE